MGYVADYFEATVESWLQAGWLPPGGKLIEFGAQEFHGDQAEARRRTEGFLRRHGLSDAQVRGICSSSKPLRVAEVYHAIGIDYTAIDVEETDGSRLLDLNCFAPPLEWREAFDLVNNEGAIEHLTNPINGFQVAHELLKPGGVAVHSIPLSGHRNHGLMHPTVKFYSKLVGLNGYELLRSEISIGQSEWSLEDGSFTLRDHRGRPLGARNIKQMDAWLHLAYRKTAATEFCAPWSHWQSDDSEALAVRLGENFAAYSMHRLSEGGQPIADEFERQAELQRREHAHRARLQARELAHAERVGIMLEDRRHEYRRKLQVYEHAHADALGVDLQRREHQHADALGLDLQRREHAHATEEAMARRLPDLGASGFADRLALFAIVATIVLNGAGLLLSVPGGSHLARWLFAAGLMSAFLPTVIAWTGFPTNPTPTGRLVRHGARLLWLIAAGLFVLGCLLAAPT
jgi:SAM-dependent methyltransferase